MYTLFSIVWSQCYNGIDAVAFLSIAAYNMPGTRTRSSERGKHTHAYIHEHVILTKAICQSMCNQIYCMYMTLLIPSFILSQSPLLLPLFCSLCVCFFLSNSMCSPFDVFVFNLFPLSLTLSLVERAWAFSHFKMSQASARTFYIRAVCTLHTIYMICCISLLLWVRLHLN